ncbi:bacteriocin [Porphyromonas somerae]|nr:bacteriocin [Porphyromonas somerae]MDY3885095.1 bacteriocin [Porphyromonas somerae]
METLNEKEMREVNGGDGVSFLVFKGFLDGEKGNEEIWLFGFRIY